MGKHSQKLGYRSTNLHFERFQEICGKQRLLKTLREEKKIRKSKQLCSGVMKFSSILSPRGRSLPKAEAVRKVPMGSGKHRDQGKCRVTRHFITPTLISPEKSLGLHQSKICNTFKYFFFWGGVFSFFSFF